MNAVMAAGIETPLGASTEEQQTAVSSTITDLMTQWIPATAGHCQKGVMIPKEKDKHDIFSIAQFQLSLPLMDTFLSTFEASNNLTKSGTQPPESFRGFLGPDFPSIRIVLYAPLLVTNAPILILHNDVDLKQIESAKDVVDIADAQPYVTWVTNTLGSVGKHTREDVNRILKEIDAKPALPSFALTAFAMFLLPRRFHVVQVDALDPFIREIEKNFIDGCKKLLVEGAGSATS